MDFSDGKIPSLEQHPDIVISGNGPGHLQRNKTERRRLQGLQRTNTTTSQTVTAYVPRTMSEKISHWMINEGGRRIFFFVFLLLHVLVLTFGFMHYRLKDNLVTSNSTFGITFRKCLDNCAFWFGPHPNIPCERKRLLVRPRSCCTST